MIEFGLVRDLVTDMNNCDTMWRLIEDCTRPFPGMWVLGDEERLPGEGDFF